MANGHMIGTLVHSPSLYISLLSKKREPWPSSPGQCVLLPLSLSTLLAFIGCGIPYQTVWTSRPTGQIGFFSPFRIKHKYSVGCSHEPRVIAHFAFVNRFSYHVVKACQSYMDKGSLFGCQSFFPLFQCFYSRWDCVIFPDLLKH